MSGSCPLMSGQCLVLSPFCLVLAPLKRRGTGPAVLGAEVFSVPFCTICEGSAIALGKTSGRPALKRHKYDRDYGSGEMPELERGKCQLMPGQNAIALACPCEYGGRTSWKEVLREPQNERFRAMKSFGRASGRAITKIAACPVKNRTVRCPWPTPLPAGWTPTYSRGRRRPARRCRRQCRGQPTSARRGCPSWR